MSVWGRVMCWKAPANLVTPVTRRSLWSTSGRWVIATVSPLCLSLSLTWPDLTSAFTMFVGGYISVCQEEEYVLFSSLIYFFLYIFFYFFFFVFLLLFLLLLLLLLLLLHLHQLSSSSSLFFIFILLLLLLLPPLLRLSSFFLFINSVFLTLQQFP